LRYYDIKVTNAGGTQVEHWTSHPNGPLQPPDPGALKVEIDATITYEGSANIGSLVRVWGISLADIAQANNLTECDISVLGGMGKGLPLANPAEAGTLFTGKIQKAFANWVGTTMTLDMICYAGTSASGVAAPTNITFNAPAGSPLGTAIQNTIETAMPGANLTVKVDPSLVLPNAETHFCATFGQFADYIVGLSRRIVNSGPALYGAFNTQYTSDSVYPGVQISIVGNNVTVTDGTQPQQAAGVIAPYDLIGQPTWLGSATIQATLVMRGDLKPGAVVTLPQTRAIVTAASNSQAAQMKQSIVFQGAYSVIKIHHVGDYKDPGALSWVTVVDLVSNQQPVAGAPGQYQTQTSDAPSSTTLPLVNSSDLQLGVAAQAGGVNLPQVPTNPFVAVPSSGNQSIIGRAENMGT
jgi:hypothetical protein